MCNLNEGNTPDPYKVIIIQNITKLSNEIIDEESKSQNEKLYWELIRIKLICDFFYYIDEGLIEDSLYDSIYSKLQKLSEKYKFDSYYLDRVNSAG